jgi:hypothetical protein
VAPFNGDTDFNLVTPFFLIRANSMISNSNPLARLILIELNLVDLFTALINQHLAQSIKLSQNEPVNGSLAVVCAINSR